MSVYDGWMCGFQAVLVIAGGGVERGTFSGVFEPRVGDVVEAQAPGGVLEVEEG